MKVIAIAVAAALGCASAHAEFAASSKQSVEALADVDPAFVNNLHSRSAMIKAFHKDVSVAEAKEVVGAKLPATISAMVDHATVAVSSKTTKPLYDTSALTKARKTLNGMLHENGATLDLTLVDCKASKEKSHIELDNLQADLEFLSASLAEARGQIAECHSRIEYADGLLMQLNEELGVHLAQCEKTRKKNAYVLQILTNDLFVAKILVKMTECAKSAASLMECAVSDPNSEDTTETRRLFTFANSQLQQKVALLKSDVAKRALQRALAQSHSPAMLEKPLGHYASLLQTDLSAAELTGVSADMSDDDEDDDESGDDEDGEAPKQSTSHLQVSTKPQVVSDKPQSAGAQKLKCSVSGSPKCAILNDNMATLAGEIASEKDELEHQMAMDKSRCDRIQKEYEDEISKWQTELNNQNILLATTTQSLNEWEFDQSEKMKLQRETFKAYTKKMYECHLKIKGCVELECGIRKIREKLGELGGAEKMVIEDCKVTDWIPAACSKTCNGGVMVLSRDVTTKPTAMADGSLIGEQCPPLEMKTRCGEAPCPINCRMSYWSGWSKCSKPCGGGLQQRTRNIKVVPQNGGEPCGESQQSRICNADSCDIDCKLTRWTRWSVCSKGCGSGWQRLVRHVREPAKGNGKCPRASSWRRMRMRRCNRHRCPRNAKCVSKIDIVLLFDGSGSVGRRGFAAEKVFGSKLVNRVSMDAKIGAIVSVVVFSWRVRLVQDFTSNKALLEKKIKGMKFPRSSTNTAGAFNMARQVMLRARKTATTVVMMVTDGRPNNGFWANIAAKGLKRSGARVILVGVGPYIPTRVIKMWASKPSKDNVYRVSNFKALDKQIGRFVSAMCPVLA